MGQISKIFGPDINLQQSCCQKGILFKILASNKVIQADMAKIGHLVGTKVNSPFVKRPNWP